MVLVGASSLPVETALEGLALFVHEAASWTSGIGGTIADGMAELARRWPDAEGVLLMTGDQPLVSAADLRALGDAWTAGGRPMAACAYAGTVGIPALFARACFGRLAALTGDRGAAAVLRDLPDEVTSVPCPAAAFDVDTEADVAKLPPMR